MADYIRNITNGTMMIRDTGGNVEFWFKTGSSTFNHNQTWGYQANGAYHQQDFDLRSGGAWQLFGAVYIGPGATQDVLFRIFGEGTGWPTTDFWQTISRTTVPPAPTSVNFSGLTSTSVHTTFGSNGDGGSGIIEWQLAWGTDPWTAQYYTPSSGSLDVTNLVPGTTFYFWARGRNALGWGNWSVRSQITTLSVPPAPSPVEFTNITQNSVHAQYVGNGDGGAPILQWQFGYGKDPDTPQLFIDGFYLDFLNLDPGKVYYFWARGRNWIGWGPWSVVRVATLIAGARVKVDTEWKRAVPYVKVAGVWKLARPWYKVGGIWKESTQ